MIETDVLVVGGGGAASLAAAHASKKGAETTLVCKGGLGRSGATVLAGAGIQMDGEGACKMGFPGNPKWTKSKLFQEIVIEGFYLNNQKLVEVWTENAASRISELLDYGLKAEFQPPGSLHMSGLELARACADGARRHDVTIIEDVMVIDLLTTNGKVVGALAADIITGELLVFKCKAIVLATGGWHQAYPFTSGTRELTGDGQAMAYRAGARLINMEMVTFCPNTILWPRIHRGSIFGYVASFAVDTKMLDNKGEDIMLDYDPRISEIAATTEFNKNIWSIACARTVEAGKGSPHGGVFWSMRHLSSTAFDDVLAKKFPDWRWQGEDFSDIIELLRQGKPVEVAPAAHYFEGGISINERCETQILGLYAAGECGSGVFGANRVCDATTEMVVFGGAAGEAAAKYAKRSKPQDIDNNQVKAMRKQILEPLPQRDGNRPARIRERIQDIAIKYVGIIRNGDGLRRAIEEIEAIQSKEIPRLALSTSERPYNKEWIESLEVRNLITCLEASARAGLLREESRGLHYRTDYPRMNHNQWLKEIVISESKGKMTCTTRPVTVTKISLPSGTETWEDYIVRAAPVLKQLAT